MEKIKSFIWLFLLLAVFSSCRKPSERPCWKKSGSFAVKEIQLDDFNRLFLKEHISYTLIQDSTNKIVIKGGENLIGFIHVQGEDGLVSISNNNKCNFFRKYEVVEVEIHFTSLVNILFEGTETLNCADTLNVNYLTVTLRDGGGSMDLLVNALDIRTDLTNGWGDLVLRGNTNTASYQALGNGFVEARDLQVRDSINFISSSSTIQKINTSNCKLKVEINGIGDIWYYGLPTAISKHEYGKGKLIDKN